MHKIFAKPLFLGKKVLYLPHCHSTNDELSQRIKLTKEPEGYVIYTDHQEKGKGQRGNVWLDESGKNVLMSVLLRPAKVNISDQHYLNLIVGLAILDAIAVYTEKAAKLKWPNDVYVNGQKISGVLIENSLRGRMIETAVVGIGFNLNQQGFSLPNATSLAIEIGTEVNREEFIEHLLSFLEKWYRLLLNGEKRKLIDSYHDALYWKGEVHEFMANNESFLGRIEGIDQHGRLIIIDREDKKRYFNVKEVEFVG